MPDHLLGFFYVDCTVCIRYHTNPSQPHRYRRSPQGPNRVSLLLLSTLTTLFARAVLSEMQYLVSVACNYIYTYTVAQRCGLSVIIGLLSSVPVSVRTSCSNDSVADWFLIAVVSMNLMQRRHDAQFRRHECEREATLHVCLTSALGMSEVEMTTRGKDTSQRYDAIRTVPTAPSLIYLIRRTSVELRTKI